jgi:TonB family protein
MKLANRVFAAIILFTALSPLLAQTVPAGPQMSAAANADPAPPAHPATEAQIREYLAMTHAIENAHKTIAVGIQGSRATSAPYFTASFWDDMEKAVMDIDLAALIVPAYQKYFSEEDMAAMLAFYKTPAGQRLLTAQPLISAAVAGAAREAGQMAGREVGLKHQDEIQSLMKSSQAAQAPVAGVAGTGGAGVGVLGATSSVPGGAVRVSSGVMAGSLVSRADPVYPAIAKAAHVQGAVILHAVISKDGEIEDLAVVSGPSMLQSAAMDAVRRWKYKPYLLQGVPTAVETTITVNFTFAPAPNQTPAAAPDVAPAQQN